VIFDILTSSRVNNLFIELFEKSKTRQFFLFSIPKKPDWKGSENAAEFKQLETKVFLDWKRRFAKLQNKHPNLPPFEKNLDFWRQLWKIIELSDVVVQVKRFIPNYSDHF
jgi:hypothetical protein